MHRSARGLQRLVLLAAGTAFAAGVTAATLPAASASASIFGFQASGLVSCANGWQVVGVWVNAGGSSGWASLSAVNRYGQRSYSRGIDAHPTYTLNVGCGGTPQNWATSNHAQGGLVGMTATEGYSVNCNDRGSCSATAGDFDE
jgi:hypothetical protein